VRSYERHQLKENRFAATTAETLTWASDHRKKIVKIAIAAGLALIVIAGIWWYLRHREEQASAALATALETYNSPVRTEGAQIPEQIKSFATEKERAQASVNAFRPIAEQYSHSRSGQLARYFLGLSEQDMGNNAEAEKQLKAASDGGNGDVAAMAKFALASLYRSMNRPADGIKVYKELADKPTVTVPKTTSQLELAEVYAANQQQQEAAKLYEQIAKENPQSLAGQLAASKRQQLPGVAPAAPATPPSAK
jgi:tetratricopeptide (TPR) repeat protein